MAFCTQCGNQVGNADVFCRRCGARQGSVPPSGHAADPLAGFTPRVASILCYVPVVGWVPAVIVLASSRYRGHRDARFHAFQGLYLFVAWLIVDWVVSPLSHVLPEPHVFPLASLLHALLFCAALFMIIKASHEEAFHLPILGELAERSVAEQR